MNRSQQAIIRFGVVVGLILAVAAAAQEAKPPARKPRLWAIVVGIDNYIDPSIPDSRAAVRDAGEVRGWFLGPGGWDRAHVLFLADQGSRQPGTVDAPRADILPIQDNLEWAFQKWLPAHARPGDQVVFYFAGRVGTVRAPQGPLQRPRAEYYLLPRDANGGNVAATGWSLDKALDRFVRDTGGRCPVVCWLATTLGSRPTVLPAPVGETVPSGRDWLVHLARWPGVSAWLAADKRLDNVILDEPSTLFTRTLLGGLGQPAHKQNVTAALDALQRNPDLKRQGFQTLGAVPSRLTLWADLFGQSVVAARPEIVLQVGHADRVTGIVASADGQRFVTSSRDSTVRIWSLKDRALLRVLSGHEVGATALGWSADGRWLVSGGGRPANAILFHDMNQDSRTLAPDQVHNRGVVKVAMLPDGDHCVTVDLDARSFLWNLKAQPPEATPWPARDDKKPAPAVAPIACLEVACGGDAAHGAVAVLGDDRTVRLFNPSGAGAPVLKQWPDQPTTLALDPAGRWLAVGFADGRVAIDDLATGEETQRKVADGPISRLAFSSTGLLAVGHGRGVSAVPAAPGPARAPGTLTDQPPESLVFSPDGLCLAACARNHGGLEVWEVAGDEPKVVVSDKDAGISWLAFTGDSRTLIAGGFRGSLKTWSLGNRDDGHSWSIPAHQSKVRHLSASPSRQLLFLLNDLNRGQIWDLKERTCRQLPGAWAAGTFAAGDDRLVLTEAPAASHPGRLVNVRIEREKIVTDPAYFQQKSAGFEVPEGVAFARVAIAPDGSRIAASAHSSLEPLVCVWDAKSGQLTHWLTPAGLEAPVECLSFSTDARYLLTAGDSPEARLWDLAAAPGEAKTPAMRFHDPDASNVTSAQVRPGDPHQVVTGHSDGRVRLRNWRDGQPEQAGPPVDLVVGLFAGKVKALTFASDGRHEFLAAGGDGTSMWLGMMAEPRPTRLNDLGTRPHHFEQINALISWPPIAAGEGAGTATVISGSDDTTVKIWELKDRGLRLRGIFTSASGPEEENLPADPAATTELNWLVFTPDGHFDASAKGRERIRFRHNDQARAMEQFDDTKLYTFDLARRLLDGEPLEAVAQLDEPPPIAIESPPRIDPHKPDTQMTVVLGSRDQHDVRLYHNNVPVFAGLESAQGQGPPAGSPRIEVPVRMVRGANRFYAMATTAGRDGSYDSRSPEVELVFDGPTDPGRLHVISLGVSDYKRRRLKYPDRDAEQISEVLHERGFADAGKSEGLRIVRTNSDVTTEGVNSAFREVADQVKGRPQDTVVVFLAGHTGVFDDNQFGLLLPSYQFSTEEPTVAQLRGAVIARSSAGGKFDPKTVMPYALIEANLMRLHALNRLVIVDACQAEAIFDDAQVKEIRKWMEIRSRRARTSYLMAARRGEPALEIEGLRHGLFTYTLLRGMGAAILDRNQEPGEIRKLNLPDDADFNRDGTITTGELDQYARRTLPAIAQLFPLLVTRSRAEELKLRPNIPAIPESELEQELRMQSTNVSFPLLPLARKGK